MYIMLRKINFYSISFVLGISVLLILAGTRYTENPINLSVLNNRRNIRNFLKVEYPDEDSLLVPTSPVDGSPDIEIILENTRMKIKKELSDYDFSTSGVNDINDLLIESGGKPKRNIVISTWRSGTTFLGEILYSVPGTYYHYEPLLKHGIIQIGGAPHADDAIKTIKNMLECNHKDMQDYFDYGKLHDYQFSHNTRLWDHCKYKKELCLDPEFTSRFCKLFPFQSMKVVRLRLRLVEELLINKDLNLKILLLIRDPRAVMQSRQHRNFCHPSPDCWKPSLLCDNMISDYVAAARLLKTYPNNLMVLRYEELALKPYEVTRNLFKFFGLSITQSVEEFLDKHTGLEVAGVSSTFRVSHQVPFKWKTIMNYTVVEDIQESCKEAMNLWGYNTAYNASHMKSNEFNPIGPYEVRL